MAHIRKALGIFLSRGSPEVNVPYSRELLPALVAMGTALIVLLLEHWF